MKAILNSINTKQDEIQFPVVAEYVGNSGTTFFVLFTNFSIGTVIYNGDSQWQLGHYSESWISVDHKNTWKVCSDITISYERD